MKRAALAEVVGYVCERGGQAHTGQSGVTYVYLNKLKTTTPQQAVYTISDHRTKKRR